MKQSFAAQRSLGHFGDVHVAMLSNPEAVRRRDAVRGASKPREHGFVRQRVPRGPGIHVSGRCGVRRVVGLRHGRSTRLDEPDRSARRFVEIPPGTPRCFDARESSCPIAKPRSQSESAGNHALRFNREVCARYPRRIAGRLDLASPASPTSRTSGCHRMGRKWSPD